MFFLEGPWHPNELKINDVVDWCQKNIDDVIEHDRYYPDVIWFNDPEEALLVYLRFK